MEKLRTNIMAGMVAAASVATLSGCALVDVAQNVIDSMRPETVYGPPPIEDEFDPQMIEAVYGPPPEFYENDNRMGIVTDDGTDETAPRQGLGLFDALQAEEEIPEPVYGPPSDPTIDDPASIGGYTYDPAEEEPVDVYGPPSDFGISEEEDQG